MSAVAAGGRRIRWEASTRLANRLRARAGGPGREGWRAVTRQEVPDRLSRTSKVAPPACTRSPVRRQERVTTRTLAVSVSSPPYWASITCTAVSGLLPAPSTRRTAASLQAGTSSPGPGRHGDTSGSSAVCGGSLPAEAPGLLGRLGDDAASEGGDEVSSVPERVHPAASTPTPPSSSSPRRDAPTCSG